MLLAGTALSIASPRAALAAAPIGGKLARATAAAVPTSKPGAAAAKPDSAAAAPADEKAPAALSVVFAGTPLPIPAPEMAPWRDPEDGRVYVAPESLEPLGVTFIVDREAGKVSLAGPDGAASMTVSLRKRPGTEPDDDAPVFVPAQAVIEALGGKWEDHRAENSCTAFAVLTDVQMIGGQLRVRTTFPVLPRVTTDRDHPNLAIIDFPGADVGKLPRFLKLDSPNVAQARSGQFSDDTARIVVALKASTYGPAPGGFTVLGSHPATQIALNPAPPLPESMAQAKPSADKPATDKPASPIVISNNNPSGVITTHRGASVAHAVSKSGPPPTVIRNVAFRSVSDREAQIVVQAGRAPDIRADLTRGRLTLDMVNATLASASVADSLAGAKHPFLRAAQLLPRGSAAAQLVLDLTRAVNYTVQMIPGGGFILDLMMPRSAGGRLAGKLVVVDPGHGDFDLGAVGGGYREKDINLQIATKLAAALRDRGANVIMTRSTDEFVPVDGRPAIANRAGADFFISVHADSGDRNHVVNGSTVYYHMQMPSCRSLAQCIAARLSDIGSIRCKGAHSDGLQYGGRFVNGYGVLRNSQMVAVLCECGYMSNASDIHSLRDPAVQQHIADAIASGLRDYIEGNPNFDTRNINPQPVGTLAPLPAAPPAPGTTDNAAPAGPTAAPSSSGAATATPSGGDNGAPAGSDEAASPAAPASPDSGTDAGQAAATDGAEN